MNDAEHVHDDRNDPPGTADAETGSVAGAIAGGDAAGPLGGMVGGVLGAEAADDLTGHPREDRESSEPERPLGGR
jgi:hypothetical protein